jgi:hypothetical protein
MIYPLTVLDLFSGIGGIALGLHRATYPDGTPGFRTVAFCEQAEYPVAVLRKHWPDVPVHRDVRDLRGDDPSLYRGSGERGGVDVVAGGFPCQDISVAGRGAGLAGGRSGLWFEFHRIIAEARPRWCLIENVPALRTRGLDTVLGGLAEIGYSAEWHCIPAAALGAPHRRDRVWIVAYPDGGSLHHGGAEPGDGGPVPGQGVVGLVHRGVRVEDVAHAPAGGRRVDRDVGRALGDPGAGQPADGGQTVTHASSPGLPGAERSGWPVQIVTAADIGRAASECSWRRAESGLGREADGLPGGVDRDRYPRHPEPWEGDTPRTVGRGVPNRRPRLMALGNSVVPANVTLIGNAILRRESTVSETGTRTEQHQGVQHG